MLKSNILCSYTTAGNILALKKGTQINIYISILISVQPKTLIYMLGLFLIWHLRKKKENVMWIEIIKLVR